MANPSGQNGPINWNGFVQNPPAYGDKQRQGDLARTSPIAGQAASSSALNSPRRAKRKAITPQQPVAAPPGPTPDAQGLSYGAQLAAAWAEIAQVPGASPLVQQIAQEAQSG